MDKKTIKATPDEVPIEKHSTASWANISKSLPITNVSVPKESEVKNAKDWVDTNEK